MTGRPGGSAPGSVFPTGRDPSPGSRPGGAGSGVPTGALSPRPGGPGFGITGFSGRDPSPGGYPGGRTTLSTIYDTSPTRGPSDQAVSSVSTRDISLRNTSLHHRSVSAEYLLGRGTDVSYGGRRPLGPGRFGAGYGAPVGYTDVTRVRSAYGIGGGPFGFNGGSSGYMRDRQFIPGGYDGYIDDTGLGVDGDYGLGGGSAVHGGNAGTNAHAGNAQSGAQSNFQDQVCGGAQQVGGQQAQAGVQQSQCGGQQAQASVQLAQCGGLQAQAGDQAQIQVSAAPTGCAVSQPAVCQGTLDLSQVEQTAMISPRSESNKDTCSPTSSESDKD